jgi:hypothetical protein
MTTDNGLDSGGDGDPQRRGRGDRAAWISLLSAVLVASIGLLGGVLSGNLKVSVGGAEEQAGGGGTPTVTTTVTATSNPVPTPPVERTISSPEENAAVPLCTEVRGVISKLPADKAIVIATREDEDSRTYFEHDVKLSQNGQWRALVNLGDLDHPKDAAGHHFSIYAVVMDKDDAAYLAGTSTNPGDTYWSTASWPPGADAGDPRRLVRAPGVGQCS